MSYCPKCDTEISEDDNFCSKCGSSLIDSGELNGSNYAGFWKRVAAIFMDGIILSGAWTIITGMLDVNIPIDPFEIMELDPEQAKGILVWQLINMMMVWLYYATFESSRLSATPGKMILGIAVTDYEGKQISFGRATGRHFAQIISAITFMVGYIMAGFTERKQALHDIIAGTLVINKTKMPVKN